MVFESSPVHPTTAWYYSIPPPLCSSLPFPPYFLSFLTSSQHAEVGLRYTGGASFTISTELWMNWPTPKFAALPVSLHASFDHFEGIASSISLPLLPFPPHLLYASISLLFFMYSFLSLISSIELLQVSLP